MNKRILMLCLLVLASLCPSSLLHAQGVARLTASVNVVPAVSARPNPTATVPVLSTLLAQLLWSNVVLNQTLRNSVNVSALESQWGVIISGACESRSTKVTSRDGDCDAVLDTQVVVAQ
jgi:hypothetical protein